MESKSPSCIGPWTPKISEHQAYPSAEIPSRRWSAMDHSSRLSQQDPHVIPSPASWPWFSKSWGLFWRRILLTWPRSSCLPTGKHCSGNSQGGASYRWTGLNGHMIYVSGPPVVGSQPWRPAFKYNQSSPISCRSSWWAQWVCTTRYLCLDEI